MPSLQEYLAGFDFVKCHGVGSAEVSEFIRNHPVHTLCRTLNSISTPHCGAFHVHWTLISTAYRETVCTKQSCCRQRPVIKKVPRALPCRWVFGGEPEQHLLVRAELMSSSVIACCRSIGTTPICCQMLCDHQILFQDNCVGDVKCRLVMSIVNTVLRGNNLQMLLISRSYRLGQLGQFVARRGSNLFVIVALVLQMIFVLGCVMSMTGWALMFDV